MTRSAIVLLALPAVLACEPSRQEAAEQYGIVSHNPDSMPTTLPLQGERVPVLVVTFTATDAGYTAAATTRQGVPTSAIHQDRDVLVVARDPSGAHVASVSVDNPRLIRTTGARDPATAVRAHGTFTLALPNPDRIATVEVTVRRGPNADFKETFPVVGGAIRPRG